MCDVKKEYDDLYKEYKKFRIEHMVIRIQTEQTVNEHYFGEQLPYLEDKFTEKWIYYEDVLPLHQGIPREGMPWPGQYPAAAAEESTYNYRDAAVWVEKQKEWYFEHAVKTKWDADLTHTFENVLTQVIDQRPKNPDTFFVTSGENSRPAGDQLT